jgi:hypothetical protein
MQLSFPSLSSDIAPAAVAGTTVSTDGASPDGTATPISSPLGFAQLLATIVPTAGLTPAATPSTTIANDAATVVTDATSPTGVADSVSCTNLAPTTWTPLQAAFQNDSATTAVLVAPLATGVMPVPGATNKLQSSASAPSVSTKKSLVEEGDAQAAAVATLMTTTAAPAALQKQPCQSGNGAETIAPARAFAAYATTNGAIRTLPNATFNGGRANIGPQVAPRTGFSVPAPVDQPPALESVDSAKLTVPADTAEVPVDLKGQVPAAPVAQEALAANSTVKVEAAPVALTADAPAAVPVSANVDIPSPAPTAEAPTQANGIALPGLVTPSADTVAIAPEKIAAATAGLLDRNGSAIKGIAKSFVATSPKGLTQSASPFGIGVAERAATMPAGPTLDHQNVSETAAAASALTATDSRPQNDALPASVTLTSTAHRAVEAVLSVTDRLTSRDQHSVNLQFSVGGTDLSVRVELRAGTVHTTFRTDSPELREALSNEWQAVTSQSNGDRSARLTQPVFTANQSGTSASGDGAPRQQNHDQRAPAETGARTFSGALRASASSASTTTAGASAPTTRSVSANSVHLHTLA